MELGTFLVATAFAHIGFAAFVTAHSYWSGRERGIWPYLTLVLGLAGIAGYFFYDSDSNPI